MAGVGQRRLDHHADVESEASTERDDGRYNSEDAGGGWYIEEGTSFSNKFASVDVDGQKANPDTVHKAKPVFASVEDLREAKLEMVAYDVKVHYKTTGCAQRIARSIYFENFALGVIGFNAVWIAIDTDFNDSAVLSDAHPVFQIAEYSFLAFFSFEWLVRYLAFKRTQDCLKDFWFVFDTFLVFIMILDTIVLNMLMTTGIVKGKADDSGAGNLPILKLVRLVRLTRLSRLVRILRAMPELMILIKGMVAAMRSVGFTLLLLTGIIYFFAILFTQMAGGSNVGDMHFKTVDLSMYTLLLRGTYMDEIAAIMDEIKEESPFLCFVFLLFVLLTAWVVVNMLIGVLCEVVSVIAESERWGICLQFMQSRVRAVMEEKGFGTDEISREHFEDLLRNRDIIQALKEVGVHAEEVFEMLDLIWDSDAVNERDCISFNRCMDVALQLRGTNVATVKDLMGQRKCFNKMQDKVCRRLDEMERKIMRAGEPGRRKPRRKGHDDDGEGGMGKGSVCKQRAKMTSMSGTRQVSDGSWTPACSEEFQEAVQCKLRELEAGLASGHEELLSRLKALSPASRLETAALGAVKDGHSLSVDGVEVKRGMAVRVRGLKEMLHLNGQTGEVIGWTDAMKRWQVAFGDGTGCLLKTANLEAVSGSVVVRPALERALNDHDCLAGDGSEHIEVVAADESTTAAAFKPLSKVSIEDAALGNAADGEANDTKNTKLGVVSSLCPPLDGQVLRDAHHPPLSTGVRVELVGLAEESMNGLCGVVQGWDEIVSRWKVLLDNGNSHLVKPVNVVAKGDAQAVTDSNKVHQVKADVDEISVGKTVMIVGLQYHGDLNGQKGVVKEWDPQNERWKVHMEDASGKMLKPINLKLLANLDTGASTEGGLANRSSPVEESKASEADALRRKACNSTTQVARENRLPIPIDTVEAAPSKEFANDQNEETTPATSPPTAAGKSSTQQDTTSGNHEGAASLASPPSNAIGATVVTPAREPCEGAVVERAGLQPGQRVVVHGLKAVTQLNGQDGIIVEFDAGAQRWKVQMDDDTGKLLKPSNLQAAHPHLMPGVRVLISGITERPELNGQQGIIDQFDLDSRRWKVHMDDSSGKLMRPENLELVNSVVQPVSAEVVEAATVDEVSLAPGTRVAMSGLQGRLDLNGAEGIVEKIIKQDGEEWAKLRMLNGSRKRVRARKLVAVPENNASSPDNAQAVKAVDVPVLQPELEPSAPATPAPAPLLRDVASPEAEPRPATAVERQAELPQKVLIALMVENIEYVKLRSNAELVHGFVEKVQDAIAVEAGEIIEPKHVSATLSEGSPHCNAPCSPSWGAGSTFSHWSAASPPLAAGARSRSPMAVHVDAVVEPPEGTTAKAVQESLAASKSICEITATCIKTVPHISTVLKAQAEISVSVLSLTSGKDLTIPRQRACEALMQASTTGELNAVLQQIKTSAQPKMLVNTPPRSTASPMPTPAKEVQQPSAHPETASATATPSTNSMIPKETNAAFNMLDRNGDGVISRAEWNQAASWDASTTTSSTEPPLAATAAAAAADCQAAVKERAASPAPRVPWSVESPSPKAVQMPCQPTTQSVVVACAGETQDRGLESWREPCRTEAASSEGCDCYVILSSGEPEFTAGTRVRVRDLSNFPDMNGKYGNVVGWDAAKMRWKVRLDNVQNGKSNGKLFSPANLDAQEPLPSKADVPMTFVESRVTEESINFEIGKEDIERIAEDKCKGFESIRQALRVFFGKVMQMQKTVKSDLAPFDFIVRQNAGEKKENSAQIDEVERILIEIVAERRQNDLWKVSQKVRCSLLTSQAILKAG